VIGHIYFCKSTSRNYY